MTIPRNHHHDDWMKFKSSAATVSNGTSPVSAHTSACFQCTCLQSEGARYPPQYRTSPFFMLFLFFLSSGNERACVWEWGPGQRDITTTTANAIGIDYVQLSGDDHATLASGALSCLIGAGTSRRRCFRGFGGL